MRHVEDGEGCFKTSIVFGIKEGIQEGFVNHRSFKQASLVFLKIFFVGGFSSSSSRQPPLTHSSLLLLEPPLVALAAGT